MKLKKYENSRLIHASFGSREMFSQWFTSAFGLYTFFFYESVIGLRSELALVAFLIFAVWNAVKAEGHQERRDRQEGLETGS